MRRELTQKRLKELLHYDEDTGLFIRKTKVSSNANVGDKAGYTRVDKYRVIQVERKLYHAHRLAWLYITGEHPQNEIDHINRDPSDNRFKNLRDVTHSMNLKNQGLSKANKSGVTGVFFVRKDSVWQVYISDRGTSIFLGTFKNKQDAIKARKQAEKKYNYM